MNTQLLNAFLLDAAQQPWEQWWTATRLIFADFVEENGEPDKAGTLRAMTCEVADEFPTEGRSIGRWSIDPTEAVIKTFSFFWLELHGSVSGEWRPIDSMPNNLRFGSTRSFTVPFGGEFYDLVRISCLGDLGNENARYRIVAGNGTQGEWHGTLSLERAQRRCRRRVLEMFPGDRSMMVTLGVLGLIASDGSPRWVPFERPLHEGLAASWQTRNAEQLTRWFRENDLHLRAPVPQDEWPEISG